MTEQTMRAVRIAGFALKIFTLLSLGLGPMMAATKIPTSVVLTVTTPSTIYFGQIVDGFAKVSSGDGSEVTGTITFFDGTMNLCVIPVEQGASCPVSVGSGFAAGTHALTAAYSGDAGHSGSTSNPVSVGVLQDATTASVTSSVNPAAYGESVLFTATVQGAHAAALGPVTFLDGTTALGTVALSSAGAASLSISSLAAGVHPITVVYGATQNSSAATSAVLSEVVQAAPATPPPPTTPVSAGSFTISASPVTVRVGQMASVMVKVSAANGFNQAVQLGCSNLPSESACTFGSGMIRAGGGSTTLQLSTMGPRDCGSTTPYGAGLPYVAPMAAGLMMLLVPRRRRVMKGLLVALVALCGLTAMGGCGNCTNLGTRPGTYIINVTGTGMGATPTVVSQKVTLTVTF
jgi:hypothetical protein